MKFNDALLIVLEKEAPQVSWVSPLVDSILAQAHQLTTTPDLASIEKFYSEVCRLAEKNMAHTGKLEGAHYNAMLQVLSKLRDGK